MKKLIIVITTVLLLVGCEKYVPFTYTGNLEAVMQTTEKSPAAGSFFLFFGSMSGGAVTTKVSFAWKLNNEILFSTLDTDIVRLSFSDEYTQPKVKFVFDNYYNVEDFFNRNPSACIKYDIKYVTIMCKRELWNPVFELPLSEKDT